MAFCVQDAVIPALFFVATLCHVFADSRACQHQRLISQYASNESGIPAGHVYISKCTPEGDFESKQCNPLMKECWCVDSNGFEISQTRFPSYKNIDCKLLNQSSCPETKCSKDCVHGYEMDENNCRTCKCVDPCSKVTCRGDEETCRLVNVECTKQPCPPIPMCLPKKENLCQNGEPLKLEGSEELVTCGPDYNKCPSSHKCQLSPLGEYAVCCPKPRDVCFQPPTIGSCDNSKVHKNITRYYYNFKRNKCEAFDFDECNGNYNNFDSEEMCRRVCPVLSQCERLKEKNLRAAEKYKKPTFNPRCESDGGRWEPVQCLEHVDMCWCVSPNGKLLSGTLTRGTEPECNFREARNRKRYLSDFNEVDTVLENFIVLLSKANDDKELNDQDVMGVPFGKWEYLIRSRCEVLGAQCDKDGKFLPTQCDKDLCWCVDESGNQLPTSSIFKKGKIICSHTPIASIEVVLGFRGEFNDVTSTPIVNRIKGVIMGLNGVLKDKEIDVDITNDVLYVKFSLIGRNNVNVAYRLEQMVFQKLLSDLTTDISKSSFVYKLEDTRSPFTERIIALEHREIVSQSPVSIVAPYHTALIVIAAASAFVISILTLLVILNKKKTIILNDVSKVSEDNQKFLYNGPVYVELPKDKTESPKSDNIQNT